MAIETVWGSGDVGEWGSPGAGEPPFGRGVWPKWLIGETELHNPMLQSSSDSVADVSLDMLPDELLATVLESLGDLREQVRCMQVSKRWRMIIDHMLNRTTQVSVVVPDGASKIECDDLATLLHGRFPCLRKASFVGGMSHVVYERLTRLKGSLDAATLCFARDTCAADSVSDVPIAAHDLMLVGCSLRWSGTVRLECDRVFHAVSCEHTNVSFSGANPPTHRHVSKRMDTGDWAVIKSRLGRVRPSMTPLFFNVCHRMDNTKYIEELLALGLLPTLENLVRPMEDSALYGRLLKIADERVCLQLIQQCIRPASELETKRPQAMLGQARAESLVRMGKIDCEANFDETFGRAAHFLNVDMLRCYDSRFPTCISRRGSTLLIRALESNVGGDANVPHKERTIRFLLDRGADATVHNDRGSSVLGCALRVKGLPATVVVALLMHGAMFDDSCHFCPATFQNVSF